MAKIQIKYLGKKPKFIDNTYQTGLSFRGPGEVCEFDETPAIRKFLMDHPDIAGLASENVSVEAKKDPEPLIKTIEVEIQDDADAEDIADSVPQVDTIETMSDEQIMALAKQHGLHQGRGRVNYDKLRRELSELTVKNG